MSKASRLRAAPEVVKFDTKDGELEFNIYPLRNKQLLEIIEHFEEDETALGLHKMLLYTLQRDDPETSDKDIDEIETPYFIELQKAISKVNGLEGMLDFQEGKLPPEISEKLSKIKSGQEKQKPAKP